MLWCDVTFLGARSTRPTELISKSSQPLCTSHSLSSLHISSYLVVCIFRVPYIWHIYMLPVSYYFAEKTIHSSSRKDPITYRTSTFIVFSLFRDGCQKQSRVAFIPKCQHKPSGHDTKITFCRVRLICQQQFAATSKPQHGVYVGAPKKLILTSCKLFLFPNKF